MNKIATWLVSVGGVLTLALIVFWAIAGLWGHGVMMGGYGMMGGNNRFFNPLGWLGMGLMWLIPAGIVIVLLVGAVVLIDNLIRPSNPPQADLQHSGQLCQSCGKPARADWSTCPYCGQPLD